VDKPQPVRLSRAELSIICRGNDKLIRAFEAYIKALAELTPEELQTLTMLVDIAQSTAETSMHVSADNQILIGQLQQQQSLLENLSNQVNHLRDVVTVLRRDVNNIYERPL
jgi:archaellum component FlaC